MPGSLTLVTAPTVEPVSLAEAKDHLRVDGDDEDTLIEALVGAARAWVEETYGRALTTQTWDLALNGFPRCRWISIPRAPLQSVTSLTYYDEDLSTSTVFSSANYQVDTLRTPGVLALKNNVFWPTDTLRPSSGVVVRFVAGYGATAASVPEPIKQAIKLLAGTMYLHRETEVTGTIVARIGFAADALLASYRVW